MLLNAILRDWGMTGAGYIAGAASALALAYAASSRRGVSRVPSRLSRPHPLADANILKWQARQGELAREMDRVRGDPLDP